MKTPDPIMLEEFIRRQITKVAPGIADAPANPAECMEVKRVAARSVAAAAGVTAGDWLVSMNGLPAAKIEGYPYQRPFEEGLYRFYIPGRQAHYRLRCTGIDIGMELRPTPAGVAAVFDAHSDPSMLGIIWEQGDWPMLAELCRRELPDMAGRRGFFHRLFGVKPTAPNTPVLAFLGAAFYEQGDKARGLELLRQYDAEFRKDWTVNFGAVTDYYFALEALEAGDREQAAELLAGAFEMEPFERVAAKVTALQGKRPVTPKRWLGQTFPTDYELPSLDGNGAVSLAQTLNEMAPHQILIICSLAGYRGNGPYNEFMARYRNYATHLREFIHGLHVVTMQPERNPERSHYFAMEDAVVADGLPVKLLLEDGGLTDILSPNVSPYVLALNAQATVVSVGEFNSVDVWNAVASVTGAS